MRKFETELDIKVLSKKRGYFGGKYDKEKHFNKVLIVSADDEEKAQVCARRRVIVHNPSYKLSNILITRCEEKTESNCTLTVTGKVFFLDNGIKEFREITLEYVYVRSEGVTEESLKNHAESRYRTEIQELDNFYYIEQITSIIFSEDMEEVIQII